MLAAAVGVLVVVGAAVAVAVRAAPVALAVVAVAAVVAAVAAVVVAALVRDEFLPNGRKRNHFHGGDLHPMAATHVRPRCNWGRPKPSTPRYP